MAFPKSLQDREIKKFIESPTRKGMTAIETTSLDPYGKVASQLKQLELCDIDIKTLPLLVNNRGFLVTLNDGAFIYTEEP